MTDAATHDVLRSDRMNRVLFLLGLSVFINYIDRSNLSIAAPLLKDEIHLSASQLGTLLSAFFWTYALMQIPAGWLADRFDVKWVFGAGFFIWSAATAVTGIVHGFYALIVIRVILGIGESVAFPSYANILCRHFSESRRAFANAVVGSGLALGPAIGMLVGGTIVGRFGWRPFFIVLGLGSLLWLIPWLAWMPRRSVVAATTSHPKIGVFDILCQRSAWGTCLGQFCVNYVLYFMVTWLPFYLVRGRGLSMNQMARTGGFIFLLYAASAIAFGKIADWWFEAGASVSLVRKSMLGCGCAGIAVFLAASSIAPDRIFLWTLAPVGIFMGMSGSNCWAVSQTLAGPRVAGQWTGVQNFVGNLAGAVAPALTGFLLEKTGLFYWPFVISAGVAGVGALAWVFAVGPIVPVQWEKRLRGRLPDPSPATDCL